MLSISYTMSIKKVLDFSVKEQGSLAQHFFFQLYVFVICLKYVATLFSLFFQPRRESLPFQSGAHGVLPKGG